MLLHRIIKSLRPPQQLLRRRDLTFMDRLRISVYKYILKILAKYYVSSAFAKTILMEGEEKVVFERRDLDFEAELHVHKLPFVLCTQTISGPSIIIDSYANIHLSRFFKFKDTLTCVKIKQNHQNHQKQKKQQKSAKRSSISLLDKEHLNQQMETQPLPQPTPENEPQLINKKGFSIDASF